MPLIVLVLSLASFSGLVLGAKFFSAFALTLILQQVAITGIVGAAQTLVILTAGIDLSVGAIMVLSSVVMGQFAFRYGFPPPIAILCGLPSAGSAACRQRLPRGAHEASARSSSRSACGRSCWRRTSIYSANETIRARTSAASAPILQFFGNSSGSASAVFTYGVVADGASGRRSSGMCCNQTAWGSHVYAVGDDPEAAELSGVSVKSGC